MYFETMKLPCSQCKKICFLEEFYEIVYDFDGILFLCCKECKEERGEPRKNLQEGVA